MSESRPHGITTRRLRAAMCVVFVTVAVACSQTDPNNSQAAGSGAANEDDQRVQLLVGDKPYGTVAASELSSRPAISSLFPDVPYASWEAVVARGPGAAKLVLNKPATGYTTRTPRLYLNDDGHPSFGLFEDGDSNGRATLGIRRVLEVAVHTEPLPAEPKSGGTELRLSIDGKEQSIAPEEVAKVELLRGDKGRELGWPLAALLRGYTTIAEVTSVAVVNKHDVRHEVSAADLANTSRPVILKRNRRGLYHLRTAPEPGERQGEDLLRNVVRIEVVSKSGGGPPAPEPAPGGW